MRVEYYLVVIKKNDRPCIYTCDSSGRIKVHNNIFDCWAKVENGNMFKAIASQFPCNKYSIHKYLKSSKDISQAVFKLE